MLTEATGIPLSIEVDGANRHDVKLTRKTIESIEIEKPESTWWRRQHLCVDKGYKGNEVEELAEEFGFTLHLRSRRDESKKSLWKRARRWVVERTHSWMNRYRGILIRWCKKAENYLALLHFACGIITWRNALFIS